MRILYDARSVRTSAGRYVLAGLTTSWRDDRRVGEVLAALPPEFDPAALPAGVTPLGAPGGSWLAHVRRELPALADCARADVIFSPNGFPPRDPRAVIYFQDLYHFRILPSREVSARERAGNVVRALWLARAAPACMLAVPVSSEMRCEVERRVRIPTVTIPNGVDVGDARWTGGDDRVCVMGGGGVRKGEAMAVRAWARVSHTPAARATTLDVIGVEPAARREALRELAAGLGVADRLSVAGALPRARVLERVATARLAVSCSTLEAFGLPVAEALALGAPLLCSDIPSHAELVARAGAGAMFSTGDPDSLADRMLAALDGAVPPRLLAPPVEWSWAARASEHLDAYERCGAARRSAATAEAVYVRH